VPTRQREVRIVRGHCAGRRAASVPVARTPAAATGSDRARGGGRTRGHRGGRRRTVMRVAPSLLSADLADLGGALSICERGGAEPGHGDVMDGHFVPNLTFGLPVLAALARRTRLPLDVHLMIANPDAMAEAYATAGAAAVTVHWEAAVHLHRILGGLRG